MKILIIRFSSFGDIAQCLSVSALLKERHPKAQIDFLTKAQFSELVSLDPDIQTVIPYRREESLWNLAKIIKAGGYTHIYDAHQVLRSKLLYFLLLPWLCLHRVKYLKRSKNRLKRLLYFRFGFKSFSFPFYGAKSFYEPLQDWGLDEFKIKDKSWHFSAKDVEKIKSFSLPKDYLVFAPSAAWEMKRWPIAHWKELLRKSHQTIVFLGGIEDNFIDEIVLERPQNTFNLAGKLSLSGSALVIYNSKLVVSADTGVLHLADIMNKKTLALIGPTAFGYPSSNNSEVLDLKLSCSPCTKDGRGGCRNSLYQRCLVEITPELVMAEINRDESQFS